jgi:hypothetical protein
MRHTAELDRLQIAIMDLQKMGATTMALSDVLRHFYGIQEAVEELEEDLKDTQRDLAELRQTEKEVYQKDNETAIDLANAVWEFADWHTTHYEASSRLRVEVDTYLWDRVVDAAKPYRNLNSQSPCLLPETRSSG